MYCYLFHAQWYCSVSCFNQVILRIRREMNVERGRERNKDSDKGLRSTVCWSGSLKEVGKGDGRNHLC